MAALVYAMLTSLDGYYEDGDGRFDWAMPDEEVHQAANDLERSIGTYLYGRRMWEVMQFWESAELEGQPDVFADYARQWRTADKVVFSRSLEAAAGSGVRVESRFDAEAVRAMKESATADLSVSGGELAGRAIAAGLVDDVHLFVFPVLVGGGKRALPDGVGVALELRSARTFASGVVHLHYAVTT